MSSIDLAMSGAHPGTSSGKLTGTPGTMPVSAKPRARESLYNANRYTTVGAGTSGGTGPITLTSTSGSVPLMV